MEVSELSLLNDNSGNFLACSRQIPKPGRGLRQWEVSSKAVDHSASRPGRDVCVCVCVCVCVWKEGHGLMMLSYNSIFVAQGGTQVPKGAAPSLRISRKKGSFFKTSACPRFCKRRVLFCTQVRSMGVKIPLQSTKYTRLARQVTPEMT